MGNTAKGAKGKTAEGAMGNTAEGAKGKTAEGAMKNTRINGAPYYRKYDGKLDKNRWKGYAAQPDALIKYESCLQLDIFPQPQPQPKPDIFVNFSDDYGEDYFVAYSLEEDGSISPKYHIYLPAFIAEKDYLFTGCNGLYIFYHSLLSIQILWNPTTGGYKVLPKPSLELEPRTYLLETSVVWSDHGFEDYKVMNLFSSVADLELSDRIELYSRKLNAWKKIPCPDIQCCFIDSTGACVAGVFYIKAILKNQTKHILSFDFSTETLSTLPIPLTSSTEKRFECDHLGFLEYKGSLGALACWYDKGFEYDCVPLKYELWIMSDGSWARESVFHTRGIKKLLRFSQDGNLVYFASLIDELVMFNRASGELKHLRIDWGTANDSVEPMMIPFFESFATQLKL